MINQEPSFVDIYTISSTQLDWPMHRQDNINLTRGVRFHSKVCLPCTRLIETLLGLPWIVFGAIIQGNL